MTEEERIGVWVFYGRHYGGLHPVEIFETEEEAKACCELNGFGGVKFWEFCTRWNNDG